MQISLRAVVPKPLEGAYNPDSIWGRDADFEPGRYYLVKAFSGKGKSTLIAYLAGTRNDYSGEVLFDQRSARTLSLNDWSDIRRQQIAIVFQDLRLFDHLTARENILIKQVLAPGVTLEEISEMAVHLGVDHLLDKQVRFLSMGQQQRIALIRALVQPFKWLLLDEPFSHLDTENTLKMEQLIDRYCQKNGAGLILTSLGNGSSLNIHSDIQI